jgi:Raf kinase inhibitor-like YbhB/YbcL family protein
LWLVIGIALLGACSSGDDDDTDSTGSGGSGGAVATGGTTASTGGTMAMGSGGTSAGSGGMTAAGSGGVSGSGGMGSGGMGASGSGGMSMTMDGGMDSGMGMGGALTLTSDAFKDGMQIDAKYRCTGPSPALSWTGMPADTMSYAITLTDVTAGGFSNGYLHWVIYDIPAATTSLPENVPEGAMPAMPAGAKQVGNYQNTVGYDGPCYPLPGTVNTYELTLYAVDAAALPDVTASSDAMDVVAAIKSHAKGMSTITITSQAE